MRVAKYLKWVCFGVIAVIILLPLIMFALLRSQSGNCWLIEQAQQAMPEQLQIGTCEGNWLSSYSRPFFT